MENLDIHCKYRNKYDELSYIIIKDIERIKISISNLDDDTKEKIKIRLNLLKNSLINQIEKVFSCYENNHIIIEDEYVIIQYLNKEKITEINQNLEIVLGTEYMILMKRNMKDFYFCNRKVIYEIEEGDFIVKKIESKWYKEHYEIKNKKIFFESNPFNMEELLNEKLYTKRGK